MLISKHTHCPSNLLTLSVVNTHPPNKNKYPTKGDKTIIEFQEKSFSVTSKHLIQNTKLPEGISLLTTIYFNKLSFNYLPTTIGIDAYLWFKGGKV